MTDEQTPKIEFCNCGHKQYSICLNLDGFVWFICPNCGLEGERGKHRSEAIEGWNKKIAEQKEAPNA